MDCTTRGVFVGLAFGALAGCSSQNAATSDFPSNCSQLNAITLEGEWSLSASGKRYDCEGARQEGSIDIQVPKFRVVVRPEPTAGPVVIEAGDEADAFVERVRKAEVTLSSNISDDVEFEGQGDTECGVSFTIIETLSSGDQLTYDFDGYVQDVNEASGTFSGRGPGECKVSGEFSLVRR